MHDTEPDLRKRMPSLIVLGLTGLVGSGCTWVSNRIFDDPENPNRGQGNELLSVLQRVGWVRAREKGGFDVRWNDLDNQVDSTYRKLGAVDEAIKRFEMCKKQGYSTELKSLSETLREKLKKALKERIEEGFDFGEQLQELENKLRKQLKKDLEVREAIKALDKLNAYYREDQHLFRTISVSDLIVFRALMAIEKENFNIDDIKDGDKKKKYKRFIAIAKKHMNSKEARLILKEIEVEGYGDFYKRCYEWEDKDELNKLGNGFYDIHRIAATIKGEFHNENQYDYAEVMQDFGDNIRFCDDPFIGKPPRPEDCAYKLAKGVAQMIYVLYKTRQGAFFVVDCLRNPYEVVYLRREFANFFLLSLYADRETRERRFTKKAERSWGKKFQKNKVREIFAAIDRRDSGKSIEGNELLYKQNVTKCIQISDMVISNMRDWPDVADIRNINIQEIKKIEKIQKAVEIAREFCRKPLRILCLILSPGCTKPNDDEMCMNMAYTMAVKSNCISRQVGAVIIGPKGYVVGAGWNDVGEGKVSCGLRAIRDLVRDKEFKPLIKALLQKEDEKVNRRDIQELVKELCELVKSTNKSIPDEQFCFCFKDEMVKRDITPRLATVLHKKVDGAIEELKSQKANELKSLNDKVINRAQQLIKKGGERILKELVEEGDLHQLEYCLALHAEENAIIQSSKIGGMGLKGGAMYTTAQPCPLCAKKIQQIGLRRVVYTEAYPESLSEVYMKGVDLEQFEGVKPRAYIKLFMPHHDQKEWQELERRELVPKI